jgi:hypothetical protein
MMNGIDTEHVSGLESDWLQHMLKLIPAPLQQRCQALVGSLTEEVGDQYVTAVKRSIVDFVLRNGGAEDKVHTWPAYLADPTLDTDSKPWSDSFHKAQRKLHRDLFLTQPAVILLLPLWELEFAGVRLVQPEEVNRRKTAYDTPGFAKAVGFQIDRARHSLQKQWVQHAAQLMDGLRATGRLTGTSPQFWECCAQVMNHQLHRLLAASLDEFLDMIFPASGFSGFKGFALELQVHGSVLGFDVNVDDVQDTVTALLTKMHTAVSEMVRVEYFVTEDRPTGRERFLDPCFASDRMTAYAERVTSAFAPQRSAPTDWAQLYQPFLHLVDGQAAVEVTQFLAETPSFEQRVAKVQQFQQLAARIEFECANVARVGLFEIRAHAANVELCRLAKGLADQVLGSIAQDVQVTFVQVSNVHLALIGS